MVTRGLEYRVVVGTTDPNFCIYEPVGRTMAGLQRHVACSDYENTITVAGTHDTNARLLTSRYFADRQDTWCDYAGKG